MGQEEGIGTYTQGVQKHQEAVVSSHFMQKQNASAEQLYTASQFAAETLYITPQDARENLIPLLKNSSAEVVQKRKTASVERAKRDYKLYGLDDKKNVGIAECITESLFDDWFRKGHVTEGDRKTFRDYINSIIEKGEPIKMVIPMLPHKMACPLKTRGVLPCMAEAGLLARLGEISEIVNELYHQYKPETADKQMAQFIVVGDGRRFKTSLKVAEDVIENYQKGLKWWVKQLGIENSVSITDFEQILERTLTPEQKTQREHYYKDASALIKERMGNILNPMDVEGSLLKAVERDPYPEEVNPEGRFVPLFKSTMYNINYTTLSYIKDTNLLGASEYNAMYRDLTKNLFTPYADISEKDGDRVFNYLTGTPQKDEAAPTVPEIKEYVRRSMLAEAWQSTMDYLALVIADRDLAEDPISHAIPDSIRYSIHAKPGQIALVPDSNIASPVQPWHGSGVLHPSHTKIKLSNDSALDLEGTGARPVIVRHSDKETANAAGPDDLLEQFANCSQPLVYVHPSLDFYDVGNLKARFTHCK